MNKPTWCIVIGFDTKTSKWLQISGPVDWAEGGRIAVAHWPKGKARRMPVPETARQAG